MPPLTNKRLTANPARPARYFPGKATAPELESSDEDEEENHGREIGGQQPAKTAVQPIAAPKASSFPSRPTAPAKKLPPKSLSDAAQRAAIEAEFETEEESDANGEEEESGSGSEESGSEEDSEEAESSEDDRRRKLLRPTFVKKDARVPVISSNGKSSHVTAQVALAEPQKSEQEIALEEVRLKEERQNELVQAQIEKNAAAKAAGKKFWDDEEVVDEVDDTDDIDPVAEYAAWKLRELTRIKRDRDALIAAEKEREEIERRRNLTKEEREAEDREHLDKQQQEKDSKGKMGYMQRYFHSGAFFSEDTATAGLQNRDVMGGRYADDVVNRENLPEYMQIRDMAKLGKKGRTRYRDMKSEDTGRFGEMGGRRRPDERGLDDRFRSDYGAEAQGPERSGANAGPVGEWRRFYGREGQTERSQDERPPKDIRRSRSPAPRKDHSRERSPVPKRRNSRDRRRSTSRDRRREDSRERRRDRSRDRSKDRNRRHDDRSHHRRRYSDDSRDGRHNGDRREGKRARYD